MWTAKTKILLQVLATCGCLLLAVPAPGAAQETLHESLPVGAKARLGRGVVEDVRYSRDGSHLVVGSRAGLWLFNAQTYQFESLITGNPRHGSEDTHRVFSPDGRSLASFGNADLTIHLWDAATGSLRHILQGHKHKVTRVIFSPDGQVLVSIGEDGTVRRWNAVTGTLRHTLRQGEGINSAAFSPDGRTLASTDKDGVRLWDVATGSLRHTLRQGERVNSAAFSPDGRTLASNGGRGVGKPGSVQLWDTHAGALRYTLEGHSVISVAFSPDVRTFATAGTLARAGSADVGEPGSVRLWDTDTGALRDTLDPHDNAYGISSIAFSPDGRTLASTDEYTIHLWDVATGTLRHTLPSYGTRVSAAFSPDGRTLASTDRVVGAVLLWDVAAGTRLHFLPGHTDGIRSMAFSPDGRTLASTDRDGVRLWDVATGTLRHTLTTLTYHLYWGPSVGGPAWPSVPTAGSSPLAV